MAEKRVGGWRTRFGKFVAKYGVSELARDLSACGAPVIPSAVYKWVAGNNTPRAAVIRKLVTLSSGKLCHEDIYSHRDRISNGDVPNASGRPPVADRNERR